MPELPRILMVADVAKLLGWSHVRTWRWMQKTGIAAKRGGRWITTLERISENFPELLDALTSREEW